MNESKTTNHYNAQRAKYGLQLKELTVCIRAVLLMRLDEYLAASSKEQEPPAPQTA